MAKPSGNPIKREVYVSTSMNTRLKRIAEQLDKPVSWVVRSLLDRALSLGLALTLGDAEYFVDPNNVLDFLIDNRKE